MGGTSGVLAAIPSPPQSVWYLGPLPVRAYALCILAGVVLAVVVGQRRLSARGGPEGFVADMAVWAVPAGVVGARIYHVVTTPGPYLGEGGSLVDALKVWEGGLGIWGGIAGGALAAYAFTRSRGVPFAPVADAVAPGLALAQAVGRVGNWFNVELFGRPTDLPWALEVPPDNAAAVPGATTYHPVFLYELLWLLGVAAVCVGVDRRWRLGHGRVFWLYVAAYTAGRAWIETLRIDTAEMVLGLRLNVWTSLLLLAVALAALAALRGRGREDPAVLRGTGQRQEDPEEVTS